MVEEKETREIRRRIHILQDELLKDPLKDRVVSLKDCPMPPQKPLSLKRLMSGKKFNADLAKEYFYEQGILSREAALQVLNQAAKILDKEPNLLRVDGKVTIIGDIHG